MTTCEFIKIGHNFLQCVRCGNTIEILDDIDLAPIFPCFGGLEDPFKATELDANEIKNRAQELMPEGLDMSEMCSTEQILERYRICGNCNFFNNNTCTKCGCLLSRDKIFMSKLSWKNEECPEKKWTKLI